MPNVVFAVAVASQGRSPTESCDQPHGKMPMCVLRRHIICQMTLVGVLVIVAGAAAEVGVEEAAGNRPPSSAEKRAPAAPSGPTGSTGEEYDAALAAWKDAIRSVELLRIELQATPDASRHDEIAQRLREAIDEARPSVDGFVDVALARLQRGGPPPAGLVDFLRSIVAYYALGDKYGDGGDQFERALPIAEVLIAEEAADAGVLQIAGIAAVCLHEFDRAERYFQMAIELGALDDSPPAFEASDPRVRLWNMAKQYYEALSELRERWDQERQLRELEAEADDLPRVKLTTSEGDIVLELFENEAPQAVANFLTLVRQGYYDGLLFHRVLPGFMAQGGDNQRGGPGYTIRCECYGDVFRRHFRGSLSMAKPGFPPRDSGSAQFFLALVPVAHLDGKHTVFGRVLEGMEVLSALKKRDPQKLSPHAPDAPDRILRAAVLRDRGHAYAFEKLGGTPP